MYIGEFAEKMGVSLDTLRFYDRIGLLSPERKGNARWYQEEDLKKFKEIQLIKSLQVCF